MNERAAAYFQAFSLVTMGCFVLVKLTNSGDMMLGILEGVLIPAGVFYEWWTARPEAIPAILRLAALVSIALLGIIIAL